jgi:cytochrome c oxidase assembly protein subunit 15
MDFAQGFQIWRELGMLQDGSHISFAGLTAIHYVHRLMAYVVLAAMVWLALQLRPYLKAQAHWLLALAALQLATGLSNVILWPLLAAVLHTGGAAALVVVLTWALSSSRAALAPQGSFAPASAPRVSA